MSDYLKVWLVVGVCVAVPAVAWVKVRGHLSRQDPLDKNAAKQEYRTARKDYLSGLLAEKLGTKTTISLGGVKFEAVYDFRKDAVWVSSLGSSPYLPTDVFVVASELLSEKGRAPQGDAMRGKLGSPELPLDSIEGAVASEVFGRPAGSAVYRRIAPIVALMVHLRLAEYDSRVGYLKSPGVKVILP